MGEICEDCRRRLERNPLRVLDCKAEVCQPVIAAAPPITDHLCDECADHFAQLREYLDLLERPYTLNHRLVRGLDYYTKTVFEVWAAGIARRRRSAAGAATTGWPRRWAARRPPGWAWRRAWSASSW